MFRFKARTSPGTDSKKLSWLRLLVISIGIMTFVASFAFQRAMIIQGISNLPVRNGLFDQRMLLGLAGQLQLAASVLLGVLEGENIAILLNAIALPQVVWAVVGQGQVQALPGVVTLLATLVILAVMSRCRAQLQQQMNQLWGKISEVDKLNNMLTDAQLSLGQKNRALLAANATLRQQSEMLKELAYLDSLTNLPNRRWMEEHLEKKIRDERTANQHFHVIYVDFDHFKRINDQLGHQGGDEALHYLGQRLQASIHPADAVGRLGGDEFLILVNRHLPCQDMERYMAEIRENVGSELVVRGHSFVFSASLGSASFPEDGLEVKQLINVADSRMYENKPADTRDQAVSE